MDAEQLITPFSDEPVEEIYLDHAPLIKVLTQVRFPSLGRLRDEAFVGRLTSGLSEDYPLVQEQHAINLLITPTGVSQQQTGQRIWVLRSADENWKLTLAENFFALETESYSKRDAFIEQFERISERLIESVSPPFIERIGMRYMNRVSDQAVIANELPKMIRKEMLGGLTTKRSNDVELRHSISDSLFVDGEKSVQVRCGILPPRAVLDADIPPLDEAIWILDIDSFREQRTGASPERLTAELRSLADRAYRMFRWVVKPEFIEHFRSS